MEMVQPAVDLCAAIASFEPGGIVHLFNLYLTKLTDNATGDQGKALLKPQQTTSTALPLSVQTLLLS